jgi:hypothetical protein
MLKQLLFPELSLFWPSDRLVIALPPVHQLPMRQALLQWGQANTTPIWEKLIDPRYIGLY